MAQRSDAEPRDPRHHVTADPAVVAAVEPALRALGLELFDVELSGSGRARTLRVFVDRPLERSPENLPENVPDGVDLEAITKATQAVSTVLDTDRAAAAALPGPYTLEVSTPGLERTLRTPAHFRRAVGSPISLKSRAADGAPARRRAQLVAADDSGITVDIDGATEHLTYGEVLQARTVFEWGPAPKPGRARSKQQAVARS